MDYKQSLFKLRSNIIKKDILLALIIGFCIISIGLFFGWYNNRVVPVNTAINARYTLESSNPLSFMSNWDGPDYIHIATHGYGDISNSNFFPLYPILIHILNIVISSPLDSALLISWVSVVGAIYFYLKLVKKLFKITDNLEAFSGVLFFILYPTGIFLLAGYTEALFCMFSLGSIYFALDKKYIKSGVLAMFASATHVTFALVIFLIVLIMWEQKAKLKEILRTAVIGSLGCLAYIVYLHIKFHDAFGFITSQKSHGWLSQSSSGLINSLQIFNIIFIALLITAAAYWWNRKRSFSFYSLSFLLIPLVGRQFGGFNRYVLIAFPVQLMLYDYCRNKRAAYNIILPLSAICWTYFLLQYAGGYVGG